MPGRHETAYLERAIELPWDTALQKELLPPILVGQILRTIFGVPRTLSFMEDNHPLGWSVLRVAAPASMTTAGITISEARNAPPISTSGKNGIAAAAPGKFPLRSLVPIWLSCA
jgi:hypothetical protein